MRFHLQFGFSGTEHFRPFFLPIREGKFGYTNLINFSLNKHLRKKGKNGLKKSPTHPIDNHLFIINLWHTRTKLSHWSECTRTRGNLFYYWSACQRWTDKQTMFSDRREPVVSSFPNKFLPTTIHPSQQIHTRRGELNMKTMTIFILVNSVFVTSHLSTISLEKCAQKFTKF